MSTRLYELAIRFLKTEFDRLPEREKRVLKHLADGLPVSRNTNRVFDQETTFGQRLADRVAYFGGSWTFILLFAAILVVWVVMNSFVLVRYGDEFDPYPYILLNLVLSMLAALQAPVIMMSQNRQAAKDRLDAASDYEVNLKAEIEIRTLHEKLDEIREVRWTSLVEFQQEQIRLLTQLLEKQDPRNVKD